MRATLTRLIAVLAAMVAALSLAVGTAWATPPHSPVLARDRHGHHGDNNNQQQNNQQPNNQQPNPNCTLVVPNNPLTALGLSTPYQLTATDQRNGQCHEANVAQSAFVEATILDPATGALSIYRPLVVDRGTTPAIAPVLPVLPANAVVGIWFGFQGTTLTLAHAQGCVNGLFGSPFGQFAYCNAPAFFTAANAAIQAGRLKIPALGTGLDGLPCPTVRDFGLVDQDQSDNVAGSYLVFPDGRTAQFTGVVPAGNATIISNGSDNGLLTNFVDPAIGCKPLQAPDLTAHGQLGSSGALNELMAAADQQQPVALVPPNDPMTQVNNHKSRTKTNLYRLGVDQPFTQIDTSFDYCQQLAQIAPLRLRADKQLFSMQPTPVPGMGNNLFQFMTQRLQNSLQMLKCRGFRNNNGDN